MQTRICKKCLVIKLYSDFYHDKRLTTGIKSTCKMCHNAKTMKKHTKIYYDFFGFIPSDFVPSEISQNLAGDINHIDCRGMGGSNTKDFIENLMAVTRIEHVKLGDIKDEIVNLYKMHFVYMKKHRRNYKIDISKLELKYQHELKYFVQELNEL